MVHSMTFSAAWSAKDSASTRSLGLTRAGVCVEADETPRILDEHGSAAAWAGYPWPTWPTRKSGEALDESYLCRASARLPAAISRLPKNWVTKSNYSPSLRAILMRIACPVRLHPALIAQSEVIAGVDEVYNGVKV